PGREGDRRELAAQPEAPDGGGAREVVEDRGRALRDEDARAVPRHGDGRARGARGDEPPDDLPGLEVPDERDAVAAGGDEARRARREGGRGDRFEVALGGASVDRGEAE